MDSLNGNGNNVLLELIHIQVDQSLEVEIGVSDVKVLLDETFDLSPMMLSKFISTECLYDWHGFFERGNQFLKLLSDWIRVKILFNSDAVLREFIG